MSKASLSRISSDLVDERTVEDRPDLREPDALDLVRSRRTAGEDRALRLDRDAQDAGVPLAEVARDPDEGAGRSDAGDPCVDRSVDRRGDLGTRRAVVRERVDGIVELVRDEGARRSSRRSAARDPPRRSSSRRPACARPRPRAPASASPSRGRNPRASRSRSGSLAKPRPSRARRRCCRRSPRRSCLRARAGRALPRPRPSRGRCGP